MFPEGTRSRDGRIGKVRSGAAVIAAQHERRSSCRSTSSGTHDAMPPGQNWPRAQARPARSRAGTRSTVRFGEPIRPREGEHREAMERVRAFWELEALAASAPVAAPAHDVTLIHQVLLAHELEQARFAAPAGSDPHRSQTAA